jgi:putative cell wall-binding protein
MHEFGHNLGLHHGGAVDTNCKPNYLSVMNYSFQLGTWGSTSGVPGVLDHNAARIQPIIDYSHGALPTLDPTKLDESAGVGGSGSQLTTWGDSANRARVGPVTGPLDWNGNGSIDTGTVTVNIARSRVCNAGTTGPLTGHDDWAHLDYFFRLAPDFQQPGAGLGFVPLPDPTTQQYNVAVIPPADSPPAFTTASPPLSTPPATLYAYQFAASGFPYPAFGLSGAPGWLTVDQLGNVTGIPPGGTTSFVYSVTATNSPSSGASAAKVATAGPFIVNITGGGGVFVPPAGGSPPSPTLTVLGGADRSATAIAVSQATFPEAKSAGAVILARDDGFVDALAGAPLAAKSRAPLLLTDPGSLHAATAAEIQRVLPAGGTVYLLGGTNALTTTVADSIGGLGYHVVRYAGVDRYSTATAIATALGNPAIVVLADGTNFADALSAGPAAARAGGAVLLTRGPTLNPATVAWLAAHPPVTLYAIGGPASMAAPAATPLAGTNRYATAVLVAQRFFSNPTIVGLASGANYPDALSGGAAAALGGYPVVLSDPVALSPETTAYLQSIAGTLSGIDVYGGSEAVTAAVATAASRAG